MCCLTTIFLQKCLEMILIEVERSAGARRVVQVEVAMFELEKSILSGSRSYIIYSVHATNVTSCFSKFLTTAKSEIQSMWKINFFLKPGTFILKAENFIKINNFKKWRRAQIY